MYIFRADGNASIGVGHIMRCLTIADELDDVLFICADEESAKYVTLRGHKAVSLGSDYKDMESELPKLDEYITGSDNVILVDSYYVTDMYLTALKKYGYVVYMDDLQDKTYPVDAVINYNSYADESVYKDLYSDGEGTLLGLKYMPLRQQFCNRDYKVADVVKNILITTGGGDIENIAGSILEVIGDRSDIHYHVLSGQFNPHLEDLEELARLLNNVTVYKAVEDMAGLCLKCDLVITAAGTTMNELCALGVPFITFTYADNQEQGAEYMAANGITDYAGAYHRDAVKTIDNIKSLYSQYVADTNIRIEHSNRGKGLIDGKGASRIAEVLKSINGVNCD